MSDKIYKIINSHKKTFNKITKLSLNYSINFNPLLSDPDYSIELPIYNNKTNENEVGMFYFIGLLEGNKFIWFDPFRITLQPSAKNMISQSLGPINKKFGKYLYSLFDNRINEFSKNNTEIIPLLISLLMAGGEIIRVKVGNRSAYFFSQISSFVLPEKLYKERNNIILKLRK
jgi:hypothetical protein